MFKRIYNSLEIKKAIECYDRLKSFRSASRSLGISKSTIHRWYKTFHSLVVRQSCQRKKLKRKPRRPKYPTLIADLHNLFSSERLQYYSLASIQQNLTYTNKPSISWIRSCLSKSKISRRRFVTSKVCTPNSLRLSELTTAFSISLESLSNDEIICIDETGFCNIGNHTYGYFRRGKNPQQVHVSKRQKRSLVMAVGNKGVISFQHQDKPYNSQTFYSFIEALISKVPTNTKVFLMDNVAFHKTRKLKELLESKGISLLFIPPYSPRCNPIEEVFSLLKRHYRSLNIEQPMLQNLTNSLNYLGSLSSFDNFYSHTRYYLQTYHAMKTI